MGQLRSTTPGPGERQLSHRCRPKLSAPIPFQIPSLQSRARKSAMPRQRIAWRLATRSEGALIVGMGRDARVPTIDGDMDRAANGDSLNASCQDRSVPGGSSDRVDHGFSIRGRTTGFAKQHAGDFAIGRICKPSVERRNARISRSRRAFGSAAGLGPGLRPAKPRQSRIAAVARFSKNWSSGKRTAEGSMPPSPTWTRNTVPRWATRCSGPSAATLEPSGTGESWRLGPARSAGSSVRAITLGRACAAHRTELGLLVSAALAKSHPPTPGERVRLGLVQGAPAGGSFELPAILLEVRIATKIFPGEAGRVERPKFLIRARSSASRRGSSASSPLASGRSVGL